MPRIFVETANYLAPYCARLRLVWWPAEQPPNVDGDACWYFGDPDTEALVEAYGRDRRLGGILADWLEDHEDLWPDRDVVTWPLLLAALREP